MRLTRSTSARGQEPPAIALRAEAPRANSRPIVTVTKMHSENAVSPGQLDPRPSSASSAPPAAAEITGQRNVRQRLPGVARRQAISGPIPVSASSGSPNATRKKL